MNANAAGIAAASEDMVRKAEEHADTQISQLKEEKLQHKKSLIKFGTMMFLIALVIIFATIAWFSMNQEVTARGLTVMAAGDDYEIKCLTGGSNGIYYNDYHRRVESQGAVIWSMTETNNMDNYVGKDDPKKEGIQPGSYGEVSFYVEPKGDSVALDLTFEIVGYEYSETLDEQGNVTSSSLTEVSSEMQGYLGGHIMLFADREGNSEETFVYKEPILTGNDLKRVLRNKTFTKAKKDDPVNIYWVWPRTLSTMVDVSADNPSINAVMLCGTSGTDYNSIVDSIIQHPTRYFKNYTAPTDQTEDDDEEEEQASEEQTVQTIPLTAALISSDYKTYGDEYDQADNEIGMKVNYIVLKMTADKAAAPVGE